MTMQQPPAAATKPEISPSKGETSERRKNIEVNSLVSRIEPKYSDALAQYVQGNLYSDGNPS